MSKPYLTNEVRDAIDTLNLFVEQQKAAKKSASEYRVSDNTTASYYPEADRARYYDTNLNALHQVLHGFPVELNGGERVPGVKLK